MDGYEGKMKSATVNDNFLLIIVPNNWLQNDDLTVILYISSINIYKMLRTLYKGAFTLILVALSYFHI